jgi:ABC-type oligopeptide transport system ATPase subunit
VNTEIEHPVFEMRNLNTWFPIRRGVFSRTQGYIKAVNDVSLEIRRGEVLGLVGESGSGKTTLGRTLVGLETPHSGTVRFNGRDMQSWTLAEWKKARQNIQIIFQDPFASLNPRMTIFEIVTEGLVTHRLLEGSAKDVAVQLLEDVGLDADYLYRYPFEFSGGQRQRISIARAVSMHPHFIVCDEAVSALDVSVQAQIINLFMDLKEKYNLTYLFISHDLSVVRHISDRIAVMTHGEVVEVAPAEQVINTPQHPYTRELLSAVPLPGKNRLWGRS